MNKKLLLSLGGISTLVAPALAVVACGSSTEVFNWEHNPSYMKAEATGFVISSTGWNTTKIYVGADTKTFDFTVVNGTTRTVYTYKTKDDSAISAATTVLERSTGEEAAEDANVTVVAATADDNHYVLKDDSGDYYVDLSDTTNLFTLLRYYVGYNANSKAIPIAPIDSTPSEKVRIQMFIDTVITDVTLNMKMKTELNIYFPGTAMEWSHEPQVLKADATGFEIVATEFPGIIYVGADTKTFDFVVVSGGKRTVNKYKTTDDSAITAATTTLTKTTPEGTESTITVQVQAATAGDDRFVLQDDSGSYYINTTDINVVTPYIKSFVGYNVLSATLPTDPSDLTNLQKIRIEEFVKEIMVNYPTLKATTLEIVKAYLLTS